MANWYIRPDNEITISGDGSLPTEAASPGAAGAYKGSLRSSNWPFTATSGDTIWVIGLWDTSVASQRQLSLEYEAVAGSPGNRITFRGDYNTVDPAYNPALIVSMAFKLSPGTWADEGDGTYSRTLASMSSSYDYMVEGSGFNVENDCQRVSTIAECQSASGTFFYDTSATTIYVHPNSGTANDWNYWYATVSGIYCTLDSHDLNFKNITLRGGSVTHSSATGNNVTYEGINVKFSSSYGGIMIISNANTYVDVINCDVKYCKTGIYYFTGVGHTPPSYCAITGNTTSNMGHKTYTETPSDNHGIAIQGGHHFNISNNIIDDTGFGIAAYMYGNVDFHTNTIFGNLITNSKDFGSETGAGIQISTGNVSDTEDNRYNYYAYNLIINCPVGIRPGCHDVRDPEHIFNNVIYGSTTAGVKLSRQAGAPATINNQVELRNNIFANNTIHIDYASGDHDDYLLDSKYNVFAEDGAAKFHHVLLSPYYYNLAGWQGLTETGTGILIPDTSGSSSADPLFVSSATTSAAGFKVTSASPCIDAGVNTSSMSTVDYFGNTAPSGIARDIGFYETSASTVTTPTANPPGGVYTSAQSVTISTTTSGASIYYTLDGSAPTSGDTLYSAPVDISATATLKAFALKSGMTDSGVMTEAYTITGTVATPTANPPAGSYVSAQSVVLSSSTSGATIYYTTDGSVPTSASSAYTSAISITSSKTIKAFGKKALWDDSAILTASYTITGASGGNLFAIWKPILW